jgi:hypothetical protein
LLPDTLGDIIHRISWCKTANGAVVLIDFEDTTIPIPVARNDKRASWVACIVAKSRALKPVIVIPA